MVEKNVVDTTEKETKQYICEEDPSQLKLPLFGLIIDGYILYRITLNTIR